MGLGSSVGSLTSRLPIQNIGPSSSLPTKRQKRAKMKRAMLCKLGVGGGTSGNGPGDKATSAAQTFNQQAEQPSLSMAADAK